MRHMTMGPAPHKSSLKKPKPRISVDTLQPTATPVIKQASFRQPQDRQGNEDLDFILGLNNAGKRKRTISFAQMHKNIPEADESPTTPQSNLDHLPIPSSIPIDEFNQMASRRKSCLKKNHINSANRRKSQEVDRLEAIDKKETNIRIVKQTVGIKLIAKTKWPKRLIRITRSLKKDGMNQEKMLDAMSSIRQTLILKGLNV